MDHTAKSIQKPAILQPHAITFKVSVAVSALVKFYLEKNFGQNQSKIVRIDKKSTVGKFFYKCIENPHNDRDKLSKENVIKSRFNKCTVTIEITESVFCRYGILLTPTDTVEFNTFVTKLIYQAVWVYIDARDDADSNHHSVKKLMDDFCIKYGYDETLLSYERLKKARQFTENTDKGLNIC